MSLNHSPSVVTNGLVMYYDADNTKKSWKGAPITNYIANPYASHNGSSFVNFGYNYANLGATYTYVTGVDNPINSPGVLQYYTGTDGYKYFSIDSQTLPTTGTYTFSYYARIVGGTGGINNIGNSQLWRAAGSDRSVTGNWNPTFTTSWVRYSTTGPAEASTILQYFPVHSGSILGGYTIQYCGFQLELGSVATPFVAGTRTNTQAIVDLTGNNTITTTSLTYASDGTFSFDGSGNYIDVTGSGFTSGMTSYSIMHWSRRDAENRMPISFRSSPLFYHYGDNSWYYTHSSGAEEYYYPKSVSIPLGSWGFYCIVYDGSYVNIYRNGVFEGRQATTGTANWSNGLRIGNYFGSGYYHQGKIDSVSFYNRALTADEVGQNFSALRGRYSI